MTLAFAAPRPEVAMSASPYHTPSADALRLTARTLQGARVTYHRLVQNALALALLTDQREHPLPPLHGSTGESGPQEDGATLATALPRLEARERDLTEDLLRARRALDKAETKVGEYHAFNTRPHLDHKAESAEWHDALLRRVRAAEKHQAEVTRLTSLLKAVRAQRAVVTSALADRARIERRRQGDARLYRVRVPAVAFVHPQDYLVATAPAVTLTIDVPPGASAQHDGVWYSVGEYRGNDDHPGVTHKGGRYPLWRPHSRDGMSFTVDGTPAQAALMTAILAPYEDAITALVRDARDLHA